MSDSERGLGWLMVMALSIVGAGMVWGWSGAGIACLCWAAKTVQEIVCGAIAEKRK